MRKNPLEKESLMIVENLHRFASTYYGRSGWAADVTLDSGDRLIVSRYDDESEWIADGFYPAARPWPVYWNGEGSRSTLLKAPKADVQAALDAAWREAGGDVLAATTTTVHTPVRVPADRGELVRQLLAIVIEQADVTVVEGVSPIVIHANEDTLGLKTPGKTIGVVTEGSRVTRVDRPRTKTDGGNERQDGDHPAARSWTPKWESFRLVGEEDVAVIAAAIVERAPKPEPKEAR